MRLFEWAWILGIIVPLAPLALYVAVLCKQGWQIRRHVSARRRDFEDSLGRLRLNCCLQEEILSAKHISQVLAERDNTLLISQILRQSFTQNWLWSFDRWIRKRKVRS